MQTRSRIYLTGFMGSGKSTLGVRLAERLDYSFIDLDAEISEAAGMSIEEIFAEKGEAGFRALERDALWRTFDQENAVVAVGGGALAVDSQMSHALQKGLVVYLSATEDTLLERLRSSKVVRPLLTATFDITRTLEARDPVYRRAHIVLDVDDKEIEDAEIALLEAVAAYSVGRGFD